MPNNHIFYSKENLHKASPVQGNVIKLSAKEASPSGEVARVSVTERAFLKEFPSQSPDGASSPKGRAFHNSLT